MLINKKHIYRNMLVACMGVSLLTGMNSCTDKFDEWNTNPHEATDDMMDRDDLRTGSFFVQMLKNVFVLEQLAADGTGIGASTYQIINNLAGDAFAGYTGANNIWFGGSNFLTYNMTVTWRDTPYERAFVGVMNPWKEINKFASERPQVAAVATVVKILAMLRTTDMYGPLPYTRFGNGELYNPYDSQEDIYKSFFKELDNAIAVLTDVHSKDQSTKVLEKYDFLYSGNVESWIKFANSLKLRMAMRTCYVDGFEVDGKNSQKLAEEAVSHSVGVMTGATDVAALLHHTDFSYRHPLFVIGPGEFDDTRMGATMDSYLNGYKDPRISSYFAISGNGDYTGIRTGIEINRDKYTTDDFSKLAISAETKLVWMNPAEVYFLRAEGALRGWNMNGTAKDLYEQGVRTSFEYLGVSGVDAYLADGESVPAPYDDPANSGNNVDEGSSLLGKITIKWDEEAGFEENLERIITQKWIAIYPDGQEAWSEFRRTGYPKVFPVVKNNSGGTIDTNEQVRRIPFPSTEYRDNAANVTAAVALLGGDDNGGTHLWWDKKNK